MDIVYILNINVKKLISFVPVIVYLYFYITKVSGKDFKSVVLNLYYQMI